MNGKVSNEWDLQSDGDTPKGSFFSTPGSENSTVGSAFLILSREDRQLDFSGLPNARWRGVPVSVGSRTGAVFLR